MDSSRNPKRQANKALVPAIVSSSSRLLPGIRLFASIGNVFGRDALRSARRWETFALREASTYSQIRFLHRCLDNNVLPKCVSYKPPVNTDLARRAVFQHGRRMIRVLLQDCHARLRKYRQRIDQEKTRCCEFMGEIGTNLLLRRIAEQAREQRMIRDAALEKKFRKLPNPTSPRNDKRVHNLSSKELTKVQMQVLRHEASFNTTDAKPVNMIAAVESILSQTEATEETKNLIRPQVSSLLMAHRPREVLSKVERDALRELKADKDLVIVPADKGRSATLLLLHKDGAPLRPIVSLKGTPTYGLAKWLFRRLKFLTAESDTTVSSSAQFLEKLKGDLAIETIELLLQSKYDETENRLGRAQVLQLLKFCLRTYFTFDGTIYEQVKGTPMGSPISGFIAEAVLQRLESLVFQHHKPKFWARYVDDTFVVIDRDQLLTFKERLNAVFPDIQFTMEEEENNQLAFLDVLVCRKVCGELKTKSVQESDKYDASTELQQ
ncbi:hypothetical protein SprV_0401400000 [Sparganum proliferum]